MPKASSYHVSASELKAVIKSLDVATISNADAGTLAGAIMDAIYQRARRSEQDLRKAQFHEAAVACMACGVSGVQLEALLNEATINEVDYHDPAKVLGVHIVVP